MGHRRRRHRDEKGCSSSEIPNDMLQEILVKLPTKDVLRSCRVSRLWRSVVSDPSFRNLHADTYVAPLGDTEALLVSVKSVSGQMDEASVFNVSSGKAMCSFPIPSHYGLANVCNGLLCFAYDRDGSRGSAPAIVCNPATGERLTLSKPPAKDKIRMFALGFSAPTKEYKLCYLSYPPHSNLPEASVKVHVYTLGDARGWRRHSFHSPSRPIDLAAPVLIDGMLYVMTIGWEGKNQTIEVSHASTNKKSGHFLPHASTNKSNCKGRERALHEQIELERQRKSRTRLTWSRVGRGHLPPPAVRRPPPAAVPLPPSFLSTAAVCPYIPVQDRS
nr:putative F-box protein At5g15660 [Lolium perenne]